MKKAETIEEIYHIFQPEKTITHKEEDLYVNIFEESMGEFALDLQMIQNTNTTYLVAGQSGNGKSSALNMLNIKYPKLNEKYDFKYVVGRKNFEYLPQIDVADILFNIAYSIISENDELHDEFTISLEKLEKKFNNELEEKVSNTTNDEAKAQLKANIGIGANILGLFKAKTDFSTSYSLSDQAIHSATEFFKFKKQDLIKLVNEIILSYKTQYGKEIIIIVDDIEKRRDVNHLFINQDDQPAQLPILNDLNLIKIITMPIHIARSNYVKFGELKEFGLKLKESDGRTTNQKDIDLLKKVIFKRVKNETLFKEGAIDKIIEYSGANLNQLIFLIHKSALKSIYLESSNISEDEIIKAKDDYKKILSSFIMNQREFLNKIVSKKITIFDDKELENLERAISNNVVFAYFNGEAWFEINPISIESLDFYNEKAKDE